MSEILEIHDLTVSYQKKPVLWNVDFDIPSGQLVGVIGPNGAGKSTLIKTIMGLIEPDGGYVKIFGKPVDQVRDKIIFKEVLPSIGLLVFGFCQFAAWPQPRRGNP